VTFTLNREQAMLPGGYDFIHVIFWMVVIPIIAGTNFMAIALSVGLGLLLMESIGKR
jgi:hypothetical protein